MKKEISPQREDESILQRLQAINPKRQVAFIAVEQLKDPRDMSKFLSEYTNWLVEGSADPQIHSNPYKVAADNINYIAANYSKETAQRWMSVTESGHPIFGTIHLPYMQSEDIK